MALHEEIDKQGNFLFKYRGTLPVYLLLVGLATFAIEKYYNVGFDLGISYRTYEIYCLIISFLGLFIRIFTVGHAAKNTSGRNTESQVADEVNTTGIYSLVRHPLYLGNFLMWSGTVLLIQNFWFFIAFIFIYWVYYERIMFAEEQYLIGKFKDKYLDWARTKPAFIPSFKNYVPSKYSFNWKIIFRQEKNGLVATFVIFLLFDFINTYFDSQTIDTQSWLFYATIGSFVLYFIIKLLLRFSKVLDD